MTRLRGYSSYAGKTLISRMIVLMSMIITTIMMILMIMMIMMISHHVLKTLRNLRKIKSEFDQRVYFRAK